jgi:hypothetical protein
VRNRTRAIVGTLALALVLAVGGCAAEPNPDGARPVTTEEAQFLATARFRNFDAGARSISASLTDAGTALELTGWVDYRSEVGLAVLAADGVASHLLLWDATTVAANPTDAAEADRLLAEPVRTPASAADFATAAMSDTGALHPLLAILIALGNDRPDNPLLLQQGGALWLREDTVGETPVTVYAGPTDASLESAATAEPALVDPDASSTRYWLDSDGLLLRFDVRLGAEWVTVLFGPATDVDLTSPFATDAP